MQNLNKNEATMAGPVRGASARARKWTAWAQSIQILWAQAVAFQPRPMVEIKQKRQFFYAFFCISAHSEHFLFLGEKS